MFHPTQYKIFQLLNSHILEWSAAWRKDFSQLYISKHSKQKKMLMCFCSRKQTAVDWIQLNTWMC